MNIVHIAPNSPYNDYWGYQENLLPKYQQKLGHKVSIIVTNKTHKNGEVVYCDESDYVLSDGVKVYRRKYRQFKSEIMTGVLSYIPVENILEELKPDFIFFHGLISATILSAVKYKKRNPECVIVQDNHMDFYNLPVKGGLKAVLFKAWYRCLNRISIKYVDKIYGVTPWREQFAEDYFKIPRNKIDLLVMGADTEKVNFAQMPELRNKIREQLDIEKDDFVLISGGKIDKTKNIHLLMEAVKELNTDKLKLIVFGNPDNEMEKIISEFSEDSHIRNIGWQPSDKVYDYFLASDLAVFPGTHSVLWEQACGCGIPLIVKDWEGMHHVDVGGNCEFLSRDSVDEIKELIYKIYSSEEKYERMKAVADEKGIAEFSYKNIAAKAIEVDNEASAE